MANKDRLMFVFAALGGFGGLACILQWLGIAPKDLAMTNFSLPHVLWLLIGIGLFAASLFSTLRSGFFQRRTIVRLQGELSKCVEDKKDYARRNLEYREKLNTPPPWEGILDPLQIEALTYAKQLGELLDAAAQSCPSRACY
jgi:hypothetical protein